MYNHASSNINVLQRAEAAEAKLSLSQSLVELVINKDRRGCTVTYGEQENP